MKGIQPKEPTLEELVAYIKRDLRWLDGVADALSNPKISTGITSIKHNLSRLMEMVEEVEIDQQER